MRRELYGSEHRNYVRGQALGFETAGLVTVLFGTAMSALSPYTAAMQSDSMKTMLLALWVLTIVGTGLVAGVTAVTHWFALGSLAFVPAVVARSLWHTPTETLSESINAARK
jgi:hypothetical protein